jgi:hypothetical protein
VINHFFIYVIVFIINVHCLVSLKSFHHHICKYLCKSEVLLLLVGYLTIL